MYVNGTKLTKSADLMGHINSVFFSPGELRLIQDGPDERRRFINMSVSQTSPAYYTALLRYMRILDQRNALLKNPDYGTVAATLPVWDEQLCRYAAAIAVKRREFLARLVAYAADTHAYLTDGKETLSLTPDQTYTGDEEEIAERLKKRLKNSYEKDRRLGYTTVGPHRDDISFVISGKEARGVRFAGADAYGGAGSETCRSGNFQGSGGGIPRVDFRRRDERAGHAAAQKTGIADRRAADDCYLHACRARSVRKRSK